MNRKELLTQIHPGEDSTRQFKADVTNAESLASEMAAFANAEGGTIYIGVADDGSTPGLSKKDVSRINQLISNAASHLVRSLLMVRTENVTLQSKRIVITLTVPKGMDKPYFDKNGVIWLRVGSDKRRVNSKEELRRLFQFSNQFHADELPTKAEPDRLDKLRFRDFLRDVYESDFPDSSSELLRLLQNMNLATGDGFLNLAGVLLFAERPEWIVPQFVLKAIHFPGDEIHSTDYIDTEDFAGSLSKIFSGAMAFVMRNLRKIQAGRGVNAPGIPEIPPAVFEELLVNALVHRDYLVSAPIRLFVFDNRIEIINPGFLPNNLTVKKILAGNSNIRNPILVSYITKGILPYHGLGSGIKRAIKNWPDIDFVNDVDGCLFTAIVRRAKTANNSHSGESEDVHPVPIKGHLPFLSGQTDSLIGQFTPLSGSDDPLSDPISDLINLLKSDPAADYLTLSQTLGISEATVKRYLQRLKREGRIQRIGSKKSGHWEILP